MSTTEDLNPERGDPSEWVTLTTEETRCLMGLKLYYTTFFNDEYSEIAALQAAWGDLKTEFEHLKPYKWYTQGTNDC